MQDDAFRAHAWSTRRLIEFCRSLEPEQLAAKDSTTGWSILGTFTHLVSADGYYVGSLTGAGRPVPAWDESEDKIWDIEAISERASMIAELWDAYLKTGDDPERVLVIDKGTFECRVGVIVAHALHHGDLHREQICSIIRGLGLEPPDLQPWEYALDTGRARFVTTAKP